ncbi:MAG: rhodanese-like domain-containing protein [Pelovirga sp.]
MKWWLVLIVVGIFVVGAAMLIDGRRTNYLELSAPEAHRLITADELTLIDIRTPEEWRQTGVASGARLVNMVHPGGTDGFIQDILARVGGDLDAPIGLICRTGNRTTHVQRLLVAHGFSRIYNITEGMVGSSAGPGWIERGLPVERYQ